MNFWEKLEIEDVMNYEDIDLGDNVSIRIGNDDCLMNRKAAQVMFSCMRNEESGRILLHEDHDTEICWFADPEEPEIFVFYFPGDGPIIGEWLDGLESIEEFVNQTI